MKNYRELIVHPIIGALIGYFILHPISMVIYWFEMNQTSFTISLLSTVLSESFVHTFKLNMAPMSVAFSAIGLLGGIGSGLYIRSIKKKNYQIYERNQLLQQSIPTLISNGETELVEFKSSLRYDYHQKKVNIILEKVILKSIAGFLNAKGGVLIIGVDDAGGVLGIEKDYLSLKKKNRDGFQQKILQLVSSNFGNDFCSKIHITINEIDEKDVGVLHIEASKMPVYLNEENRTIFYLRAGNVTLPLNTSETVQYLADKKFN